MAHKNQTTRDLTSTIKAIETKHKKPKIMKLYLPAILSFHLALSNVATAALRGRGLAGGNENEDTNHQIVGGEPAANGAYPFFANPMGSGGCGASVSSDRENLLSFPRMLSLQIVSISFCSWSTRIFLSVQPIATVSLDDVGTMEISSPPIILSLPLVLFSVQASF